MNYVSPQKNKEEVHSQSEQEIDIMFPKISSHETKESLDILEKHYNKNLHSRDLANYCFKCHEQRISQPYDQFRIKHHPQLEEEPISAFFGNQCFLDLKTLGLYFQQQNGEYPSPYISPVPKTLKGILDQIFQKQGYIPNYERFLLFYPSYLEKHIIVQKDLFSGEKVDLKVAYFLAFCGAAEMASVYMMIKYFKKYKLAGGDLAWIKEGKYPHKFKHILELNRLLAKAVWQIDENLMIDIHQNSGFHWSQCQLALYLQILTFSHQNCTIALAMGLKPQELIQNYHFLNIQGLIQILNQYQNKFYQPSENKEKLAVVICHIASYKQLNQIDRPEESTNFLKKPVKKSEGEDILVQLYMKQIGQQLSKQELCESINKQLFPFLQPHKLIEKRRQHRHPTVDYSVFNFPFMAYPKLNNLTQKIADKLLNLINYSQTMTRDNFGTEKVSNTKDFRKAIRYYAQNLCGYQHHEYDYKTVSQFLTMALKFYVRLLILSPIHINRQVIKEINHESGRIECFDLGHIAVLISNTKMSLELTLAMKSFEID